MITEKTTITRNLFVPLLLLFSLSIGISASAQQTDSVAVADTLNYQMILIEDSAQAFLSEPEPIARVTNELPEFQGDSSAEWMNQQIRTILRLNPEEELEAAIHESQQTYLTDYKNVMQDFQGDSLQIGLNYESSSHISVSYNQNDYVILCNAIHDYSGGAHGMHGLGYYSFDLEDQKTMELEDVLKVDSTAIQTLLEEQFRKDYNLSAEQPLKEILFDEELKLNDNFFFTREGVGFCYGPYEVAPYAVGVIEVIIPYGKLKEMLQPSFAYRLKIDTEEQFQQQPLEDTTLTDTIK
ncbi:MAG: RsiV family protein [Sphingobacterium sp.]